MVATAKKWMVMWFCWGAIAVWGLLSWHECCCGGYCRGVDGDVEIWGCVGGVPVSLGGPFGSLGVPLSLADINLKEFPLNKLVIFC